MTSRAGLLAIIERSYAARRRGDAGEATADFHDDGSFRFAASGTASKLAGTVRGKQQIRDLVSQLTEAFTFLDQEFISIVIEGERASVHSNTTLRHNPTGVQVTTEILDHFLFKDGKIIEFVEFADTALVSQLLDAPRPSV